MSSSPLPSFRTLRPPEVDEPELEPWLGLARSLGIEVVISEQGVGRAVPGRVERWERWAGSGASQPGAVAAFTDVARTGAVWAFTARLGGSAEVYIEHRIPGRERTLGAELRGKDGLPGLPVDGSKQSWVPGAAAGVCGLVLRALRRRCGRLERQESLGEALAAIQGAEALEEVRSSVRALAGARVLAVGIGELDALIQQADALEALWLAALDRARAWLDDGGDGLRRREHLRDLRDAVEAAEAEWTGGDRLAYIRAAIRQLNLYAVAASPAESKEMTRRLLTPSAAGVKPIPLLDCNVAVAAVDVTPPTGTPGRLDLEVDVLRMAWRAARDARLNRTAPPDQLERAATLLRHRRGSTLPIPSPHADDAALCAWFCIAPGRFLRFRSR